MKFASFDAIAAALHDAEVRYLVAGGLAVNAHGYLRYTKDVDIVVQLETQNIERAFAALRPLGYRPLAPVTGKEFADPQTRESWFRDKGMQVLQLWSNEHPETPIDIFIREPFNFDAEYRHALVKPLGPINIRFVTIPTLILLKEAAGRDQDHIDIRYLKMRLDQNAEK